MPVARRMWSGTLRSARAFAEQYDVERVFKQHWLPALRTVEQRFAEAGAGPDRSAAAGGRMTRVGWLADKGEVVGGAELTQAEFRAAAPAGVEIVDCPPGGTVQGIDVWVVQNCVQYDAHEIPSGHVVEVLA